MYDLQNDLNNQEMSQLVEESGGIEELQQILNWCNANFSRQAIKRINSYFDEGDFETGKTILMIGKSRMSNSALKIQFKYADFYLLALDGWLLFRTLGGDKTIESALEAVSILIFYIAIWRPLILLATTPEDNVFFRFDLSRIQSTQKWLINSFKAIGIGMAVFWFAEKSKIIDFGTFDFFFFVFGGLYLFLFAGWAAVGAWTFWKNGLIGFYKELGRFKKSAGYKITRI